MCFCSIRSKIYYLVLAIEGTIRIGESYAVQSGQDEVIGVVDEMFC